MFFCVNELIFYLYYKKENKIMLNESVALFSTLFTFLILKERNRLPKCRTTLKIKKMGKSC